MSTRVQRLFVFGIARFFVLLQPSFSWPTSVLAIYCGLTPSTRVDFARGLSALFSMTYSVVLASVPHVCAYASVDVAS